MAKFCEHCGARLNDGANFCSECGKRLNSGGWLYDKFLCREGRLNRWSYFKRSILAGVIGLLVAFALAIFPMILDETFGADVYILSTVAIGSYLEYGLIIRRCHDLKQDSWLHSCIAKDDTAVAKFVVLLGVVSGLLAIFEIEDSSTNLIDIANVILGLYLIFAPSEIDENEYGGRP